ncbi:hypothetical protein C7Q00_03110, partial [Staphylococcus aureus]
GKKSRRGRGVGGGAQPRKLRKSRLKIRGEWGRGPKTGNFEKKFYRQCELGWGPHHRSCDYDKVLLHS